MTNRSAVSAGRGPGAGQDPEQLPRWLFASLASGVQALAAFVQLHEPLRSIIFVSTLVLTSVVVIRVYGRPPTWFIAGILGAVGVFILTSSSGSALLEGLLRPPTTTGTPVTATQRATAGSVRFVAVSVFLDADGDGRQSPSEVPIPNLPIEIRDGDYQGWKRIVNNPTGVTAPQPVFTQGAVVVTVCGISQSHDVSAEHVTAGTALLIPVGVTEAMRTACMGAGS